jgi:hypothetical protein
MENRPNLDAEILHLKESFEEWVSDMELALGEHSVPNEVLEIIGEPEKKFILAMRQHVKDYRDSERIEQSPVPVIMGKPCTIRKPHPPHDWAGKGNEVFSCGGKISGVGKEPMDSE